VSPTHPVSPATDAEAVPRSPNFQFLAAHHRFLVRYAGNLLDLDEAATRRIIDQQLRDAGWEADSTTLSYKQGVRPQRGKNLAIAEWLTSGGPADYILFIGLTPVAAVEAKKAITDVPGAIEQAKRYSRDYLPQSGDVSAGGPWGDYHLPFCLATNGRPFLRQIQTRSGIWVLDARLSTNHPRPLEGWYSPAGLSAPRAEAGAGRGRLHRGQFADSVA
jgi:type I restriction enzyme R subunit